MTIQPIPFSLRILVTRLVSFTMLVLCAGCVSLVFTPVKKEDRDTSGKFDGTYTITQKKAPLKQNIERWVFTCPGVQRETRFMMFVKDGEVTIRKSNGSPENTYVNSKGKFRAEAQLGGVVKESARSSESITNGKRTLVYQGKISPTEVTSGQITWGVAQFGNAGCSARLSIKKQ